MIETPLKKVLMEGNHAIAQAAINCGLDCYFGYPITPQSEIGEYMSEKMPALGKTFIPAESEVAAINMCLGAGSTGKLAMTSSSSCAIALMQEGLSFIATDEIPIVVVSVMRGGPGLGYIFPSQGDYFQTVKGGGNGDYKIVSLAPSTAQEAIDLTYRSFYLSQKYRTPVFLLADGMLGQMKEPVEFPASPYPIVDNSSWALSGAKGREQRVIKSIIKTENELEEHVDHLFEKYKLIEENETSYEKYLCDDADFVISAFGSVARIAKSAINQARKEGIKVGLFRPITLFPFPKKELLETAKSTKMILDIELNKGQMVEDVKISIGDAAKLEFYGRGAGYMFTTEELLGVIRNVSI